MPAYRFHFCLPHFILRNRGTLRNDARKWPNGDPLRFSRVLSCLSILPSPTAGDEWCLYEVQTSIAVTGTHDRRWTAYCVTDDYYEAKCKDSVKRHHRIWTRTPDTVWDPIFRGEHPLISNTNENNQDEPSSSGVFWDAPQYFVAAVESRLESVTKEWRHIVRQLEQACKRCVSILGLVLPSLHLLTRMNRRPELPKAPETNYASRTEDFIQWNSEMLDVITDLIVCLSKTTMTLDQFKRSDMGYFSSQDMCIPHVTNIIKLSDELKAKLTLLELLEGRLTKANGPAVSLETSISVFSVS